MFEVLQFGDQGYGDEILRGAALTVVLALSSVVVGIVIGLLIASAKLSPSRVVRTAAFGFTSIFRGVPELLIMLVVFFGSEILIRSIITGLGFETAFSINKFAAATFALGLVFGAFSSEVFRGAFLAVPKGQVEAGLACGMSRRQIFFRIRMPQMWRFALPGLGNLWLILLKDTSLAAIITYDELVREAQVAAENSGLPFTIYLAAAVLYMIMTAISRGGLNRAELWADKGVRRV